MATNGQGFALNHIATPKLRLAQFLDLAQKLGIDEVEIRNDLPGVEIADGTAPDEVKREAQARGMTILSINALYPFDVWTTDTAERAKQLAAYAQACGARALVLCPLNSLEDERSPGRRAADLRSALSGLAAILGDHGVLGLVEPLGFGECSLRTKGAAIAAIDEVGASGSFKVLHDTFHHYLAGEKDIFPERTGLVHISGVEDKSLEIAQIRDAHRVLVGPADRMDNVGQVKALRAGGYHGPLSMEPFATSVHELPDPAGALHESFAYVAREAGLSA